ncbi:MAG: ribosome biogenesis GTPase Der [Actinobacteria bacterium]|nr:ribosome biogenesis GTPase Der [Actinomycetota bacterium]
MLRILAIDGPSGSGKSSLARALATHFDMRYLDTGALYRTVTLAALKLDLLTGSDEAIVNALPGITVTFEANPDQPRALLNGQDVSEAIRTPEVTASVSRIAAIPGVRQYLLRVQREFLLAGSLAIEGRDIGTVVAPNADLKIFLTADLEARAVRRRAQGETGEGDVASELSARDHVDTTRAASPLAKSEDAIEIDATFLSLAEVIDIASDLMVGAGFTDEDDDEFVLPEEIVTEEEQIFLPVVAILGRPNVGKSTLVNRILGRREAVVEDQPGVTRDRVMHDAEWNGRRFRIIDTGGWEPKGVGIAIKVTRQSEAALAHCDVAIFVVDSHVGALDEDEAIVRLLRKSGKPVILAANKVDGMRDEADAHALWNLGLGEPYFVSALHGRGSGDLLDEVVKVLPKDGTSPEVTNVRRVALVGRQNVGKSSMLNRLAGTERVVVDEIAGTTRDPVDEIIELAGKSWRFIDTAGIRRRPNQADGADFYAALRTQVAIERAELAIAMIDASEPLTEQDLRIFSLIEESGRALVLAFNKWDLVDDDRRRELERQIDRELVQFGWAERVNISAKTGWHKDRLAPAIQRALASWDARIPTGRLNSFLGQLISATPPPVRGGKQPRVLFATQVAARPPRFVIFSSGFLEAGYRRFIERRLREEFEFTGSPIEISVKVRERTR